MTEHLTRSNLGEGLLLGHSLMVAGALSVEMGACGTVNTFPGIKREGMDGGRGTERVKERQLGRKEGRKRRQGQAVALSSTHHQLYWFTQLDPPPKSPSAFARDLQLGISPSNI